MRLKFTPNLVLYMVISLVSVFFIDTKNLAIEMVLKFFSIFFLTLYYLNSSKSINYWYLTLLLSSLLSDVFLVFDKLFLISGTVFLALNRVLYIVILRKGFYKTNVKNLTKCFIPFLVVFALVIPLLSSYFYESISKLAFTIGVLSVIMGVLAFVNYLYDFKVKNKLMFLGLLIIIMADILIAYNKFVTYKLYYVVIYTLMYYLARFLICEAMIDRGKKIN